MINSNAELRVHESDSSEVHSKPRFNIFQAAEPIGNFLLKVLGAHPEMIYRNPDARPNFFADYLEPIIHDIQRLLGAHPEQIYRQTDNKRIKND